MGVKKTVTIPTGPKELEEIRESVFKHFKNPPPAYPIITTSPVIKDEKGNLHMAGKITFRNGGSFDLPDGDHPDAGRGSRPFVPHSSQVEEFFIAQTVKVERRDSLKEPDQE